MPCVRVQYCTSCTWYKFKTIPHGSKCKLGQNNLLDIITL